MTAFKIQNLVKSFKIPHDNRNSIRENIFNIFRSNGYEKFNAVDNLNFEIKKGEFFGIIGRNGCGKSTLLKMMAGVYVPSSGKILVDGKIVPFLELGVGFNGELTGRENVFLNAAILGLSDKEIADKYDKIVEFAELERFMDQKLKNYSSGMQVRLAFAVAMQVDADIFLMDEVLAVGDTAFQMKCFDKFRELKAKGKTIVFVTHDLGSVRKFCDRVLYLNNGEEVLMGETDIVVDNYVFKDKDLDLSDITNKKNQEDYVIVKSVDFIDGFGNKTNHLKTGDLCRIDIKVDSKIIENDPNLGFIIYDEKNNYIFGSNSELIGEKLVPLKKGENNISIEIPNLNLLGGKYYLTIAVSDYYGANCYVWMDRAYSFFVISASRNLGMIELNYNFKK